jgi:hypothetical protein
MSYLFSQIKNWLKSWNQVQCIVCQCDYTPASDNPMIDPINREMVNICSVGCFCLYIQNHDR